MPRVLIRIVLAVVFALAFVFSHAAIAGPTGASMGGGSWGTRSSSTSSTPSYSSSTPSYSSGSTVTYGSSSSTPDANGLGGLGLVAAVLVGLVVVIAIAIKRYFRDLLLGGRENHSNLDAYVDNSKDQSFANYADVTVLRVALDGRTRKFVQTELARVGKVADPATPEGRAAQLREVALLLRRLKDAWIYGGAVNEEMREQTAQKRVFDGHVADARRGLTEAHHGDPADGAILVTIVVSAHSELFEVASIGDGSDLRQALESASHRTQDDLIGIEILWMPAGDEPLLATAELEALYPSPQLIPIRGALVGKVFCAFCSGPFPAELVSCPHCGAPAAGAAAAT